MHRSVLKWTWDLLLSKNGKKWPRVKPGCAVWRGLSTTNAHRDGAPGLCWNTQSHGGRRGAFINTLLIKKIKLKSKS